MNQNSTNGTGLSNRLIETNKIDETTRETHLHRVELLTGIIDEAANRAMPLHFTVQSSGINCASLRWLIERERARS